MKSYIAAVVLCCALAMGSAKPSGTDLLQGVVTTVTAPLTCSLSQLPTTAVTLINKLIAAGVNNDVLTAILNVVTGGVITSVNNDKALNLIVIQLKPNATFADGALIIPLDFLCTKGTLVNNFVALASCHLCSQDCIYDHNTYGGQCGYSPNPVPNTAQTKGEVCICNDSPKNTSYPFTDVVSQCGTLTNTTLGDAVADYALAAFLRARIPAAQCVGTQAFVSSSGTGGLAPLLNNTGVDGAANSAGCAMDCNNNHQYVSGKCTQVGISNAVATYPLEVQPGYNCICNYDGTVNGTLPSIGATVPGGPGVGTNPSV